MINTQSWPSHKINRAVNKHCRDPGVQFIHEKMSQALPRLGGAAQWRAAAYLAGVMAKSWVTWVR